METLAPDTLTQTTGGCAPVCAPACPVPGFRPAFAPMYYAPMRPMMAAPAWGGWGAYPAARGAWWGGPRARWY